MKPHPFWVITGTSHARGDEERDTWVVCVALSEESATAIVAELDVQRAELARRIVELAKWRWDLERQIVGDRDVALNALSVEHQKRRTSVVQELIRMDRHGYFWEDSRLWMQSVKDVARRIPDERCILHVMDVMPFYDVIETSDDPTGPSLIVSTSP